MSIWSLGTKAVRVFDPEMAHGLTIRAVKTGLGPKVPASRFPGLATEVAGLQFPNPLGLAAGFDKNAEVPDRMLRMGFGFVEVGAVTPRAQPGNPKPRVFRLSHEKGVINRYGFNNHGMEIIGDRLAARQGRPGIVGINLGANKESEDRTADYVTGIKRLSSVVDFCTVNISSPNTPGLRALQGQGPLTDLLTRVRAARDDTTPIFLKVAPDLTDEDKADIVAVVKAVGIDGVIVSNTTVGLRDGLKRHGDEAGGLSGRPLFEMSTAVLRDFWKAFRGRVPLIGVGGISDPDQAYAKILAGASLIQLYTALVYRGPDLVPDILEGLVERLSADGFETVAAAVGKG